MTFEEQKEFCRTAVYKRLKNNNFNIEKVLNAGFLNFSLLLLQSCNLSCPYCYQPSVFKNDNMLMTRDIADKTFKFIYSTFQDIDIICSLFGGEPFLNYDVLKYVVDKYAMCKFMVTTNGLELMNDPVKRSWALTKKNNLIFSFSINALKFVYGEDYVQQTTPVLDIVKHNGGDVHYVLDDPKDIKILDNIRFLIDFGIQNIRISLPKEAQILETNAEDYIEVYKRIADLIYIENTKPIKTTLDAVFISNIYKTNRGLPITDCSSSFCGAGFHYIAINHKGDIYPCDYFASYPEFKIGNIENGFDSPDRIFANYPEWYSSIFEYCGNCPLGDIRLCPNAMCYAENYKSNKNIFKPTENACKLRYIELQIYNYISKMDVPVRSGIDKQTVVV